MTKRKSPSTLKKRGPKKTKPLTAQQQATVNAFLNPACKSPTAAVRAGYPKANNWAAPYLSKFVKEFFQKPNILDEIHRQREKLQASMRRRYTLTAERILDEMRCLALARATDVMQYERVEDRWGRVSYRMDMSDFESLTEESKAAIKKMKVRATSRDVAETYTAAELRAILEEMEEGGREDVELRRKMRVQEIEIEMYDKQSALKDLGKYFNLFVEKIEVEHTGTVEHVHTRDEWRAMFAEMTPEERLEYARERCRELLCEGKDVTGETT